MGKIIVPCETLHTGGYCMESSPQMPPSVPNYGEMRQTTAWLPYVSPYWRGGSKDHNQAVPALGRVLACTASFNSIILLF